MINRVKILVKSPISYMYNNNFLSHNNDISFTLDIFPFEDIKSDEFNNIIKDNIKDYIKKDFVEYLVSNMDEWERNYMFNTIHILDDVKYDIIPLNYKSPSNYHLSSSKLIYSSDAIKY